MDTHKMETDNLGDSTCNNTLCYNESIQRNISAFSHSQTTIYKAIAVLLLLSTQGTCGNIIVIYCIMKQRHLRQMTHVFAVNFCVIGLTTSVVVIPGHLFHLMLPEQKNENRQICHVLGFVNFTLILATMFNCTSIAINRFLLVTKPHLKHVMNAENCVKYSLFIMWVVSITAALTSISYTGFNRNVQNCFIIVNPENYWYIISVLVVPTFLSTSVVFILYFLIFLKVLQSRRKVGAFQSQKRNKLKRMIQKQELEKSKSSKDLHSGTKQLQQPKTIFTISRGQSAITTDPSSYFSDSCSTGFSLPSVHHPENPGMVKPSRTSVYRPKTFLEETESSQSMQETRNCSEKENKSLNPCFLQGHFSEDKGCPLPVSNQKQWPIQPPKTGILKKILCKEIRKETYHNNSNKMKNCDESHTPEKNSNGMNPGDTKDTDGSTEMGISNVAFCNHDVTEQPSSSHHTKNMRSENTKDNNSLDNGFENIDLDNSEKENNEGQSIDGCRDNKGTNRRESEKDFNQNENNQFRISRSDSKRNKSSNFGRRLSIIEKEVRLSLYLFGAFIVFSALYLPITLIYILHPMIPVSSDLWLTSYIAALSFSTFAWILYGVMNRDIRKHFLLLLKCTKV